MAFEAALSALAGARRSHISAQPDHVKPRCGCLGSTRVCGRRCGWLGSNSVWGCRWRCGLGDDDNALSDFALQAAAKVHACAVDNHRDSGKGNAGTNDHLGRRFISFAFVDDLLGGRLTICPFITSLFEQLATIAWKD